MKGLHVGITLLQIAGLMRGIALQPVRQEPNRVAVPRGDIEVGGQGEVIKLQHPTHIVVDERRIRMRAQGSDLRCVPAHHLI